MTNSAELKPCQCGMGNPKDDLIYFNYGGGYEDCDNERYAISCDLCGACGPWAESEADAAARWNDHMGEVERLRAENAKLRAENAAWREEARFGPRASNPAS